MGAYEWGASLRDVTRGTGSHGGSGRKGGRICRSAGVSEKWVAGWTVRRWAACAGEGGYMTQHIDLSLVGRVRDRGVRGGREGSGGRRITGGSRRVE